jgi:hypothetical protein
VTTRTPNSSFPVLPLPARVDVDAGAVGGAPTALPQPSPPLTCVAADKASSMAVTLPVGRMGTTAPEAGKILNFRLNTTIRYSFCTQSKIGEPYAQSPKSQRGHHINSGEFWQQRKITYDANILQQCVQRQRKAGGLGRKVYAGEIIQYVYRRGCVQRRVLNLCGEQWYELSRSIICSYTVRRASDILQHDIICKLYVQVITQNRPHVQPRSRCSH